MVAYTDLVICNLALSHIGAQSHIAAMGEAGQAGSETNLWYDPARKMALEAFDWAFARTRATLVVHGDAPSDDWGYRYELPDDFIAARSIFNPGGPQEDATPYTIEVSTDATQSLLTDKEDAILIYTFDQETEAMFSPMFVIAHSYLLGHFIAYAITKKLQIKSLMYQFYQGIIRQAEASNANQQVEQAPREAETIRGRA